MSPNRLEDSSHGGVTIVMTPAFMQMGILMGCLRCVIVLAFLGVMFLIEGIVFTFTIDDSPVLSALFITVGAVMSVGASIGIYFGCKKYKRYKAAQDEEDQREQEAEDQRPLTVPLSFQNTYPSYPDHSAYPSSNYQTALPGANYPRQKKSKQNHYVSQQYSQLNNKEDKCPIATFGHNKKRLSISRYPLSPELGRQYRIENNIPSGQQFYSSNDIRVGSPIPGQYSGQQGYSRIGHSMSSQDLTDMYPGVHFTEADDQPPPYPGIPTDGTVSTPSEQHFAILSPQDFTRQIASLGSQLDNIEGQEETQAKVMAFI